MSDNDDLLNKYGSEPEEVKKQDNEHHTKWGAIDLIGGIIAILIGLVMSGDSSQYVYYGIIWVGTELILLGFSHFLFKKGYNDLNVGQKILITLLSAIPAVLFAMSALDY